MSEGYDTSYRHFCFSYKTALNHYLSVYSAISARKLLPLLVEVTESKSGGKAPELDTCNFYDEATSPAFDRNRVLLLCLFFIHGEWEKYISVGFYPTRDSQPLVEFRTATNKRIVLTDQHVTTMAVHFPDLCESMC